MEASVRDPELQRFIVAFPTHVARHGAHRAKVACQLKPTNCRPGLKSMVQMAALVGCQRCPKIIPAQLLTKYNPRWYVYNVAAMASNNDIANLELPEALAWQGGGWHLSAKPIAAAPYHRPASQESLEEEKCFTRHFEVRYPSIPLVLKVDPMTQHVYQHGCQQSSYQPRAK